MNIIEQDTNERLEEFNRKYEFFKKLAYDTNMKRPELLKVLDISHNSRLWKDIQRKWRDEEPITLQRRGMLIHVGKWK